MDVALTDGTSLEYTVSVPDPLAALVLKTLAWRARLADKDVVDVHRCLTVARIAGVTPDDWSEHPEAVRARKLLRGPFATRRSTAVRALIAATCGPLTRPNIRSRETRRHAVMKWAVASAAARPARSVTLM
ncbi:MAG: hypothetical protein KY460_11370 [Actinobacteria bacterium]|nr:hypothetical protein [Actinomycetota bacterium]